MLSAAVLGSALAACGPSSTTSQSDNVVKLGVDLPLSGADASDGIPLRNGIVKAVEDANAKGPPGGFRFAVYDLDDAVQGKHDPAQGAQNLKTFVSDDAVLAVIGPFNSNVAQAEIPIANDAGLALISAAATNPGLTKGEAAAKLRTSHPDVITFFRVCSTDDRQGLADAQSARKLGLKRAFIIDDDETYGKGLADVFETQFKALGGTVAGREHLTSGQSDYKALLTKAHAESPDLVFYGGTTSTGGGLVRKQMGDAGMGSVTFLGGDGISDDSFITTAGTSADGTYYTVAAPQGRSDFVTAYRKRFGTDVGAYSANGNAAAAVVLAAIRQAIAANGNKLPSRAQVLQNVAATHGLDTPIGPVGFDKNGDTTNPALSLYEISGGKAHFVSLVSVKM